ERMRIVASGLKIISNGSCEKSGPASVRRTARAVSRLTRAKELFFIKSANRRQSALSIATPGRAGGIHGAEDKVVAADGKSRRGSDSRNGHLHRTYKDCG